MLLACAPRSVRPERLAHQRTKAEKTLTKKHGLEYSVYTHYITGNDMGEPTTTTMIFRIEPELKKAFEMSAKARDLTASQLLRKYIRHEVDQYLREHAQGALDLAPKPNHQPAPKKPAKGQKMASLAQARKGKA